MTLRVLSSSLAALLFSACAPAQDDGGACYGITSANGTDYAITLDRSTPQGVAIDVSGQFVRLDDVDCVVSALERCLNDVRAAQGRQQLRISNSCLKVKIAPDWYLSSCTGHQQFACNAPASACASAPMGSCPCRCAGIVQDGDVAVTTPDLTSLAHELTHIVVGVSDPIPTDIAKCAGDITPQTCGRY